jgi:phosphoribosylformylglycinamidine cyclo-ligase
MASTYEAAGVDIQAGEEAVERIKDQVRSTYRPEVLGDVGAFGGLFALPPGRYEQPVLVSTTDGVGTKMVVAEQTGKLDTIGIDLVAMCANDVVCTGAEPLLFLDYLAVGRLVPEEVAALVAGVAEGCRRAGCALLGGETAEHPAVMEPGRFDLAGFCVGVVGREALLGPSRVTEGDVLVGLPSTGLHANGFSLVRKVVQDAGVSLEEPPPGLGRPLGEMLLEPTAVYARPVLALARAGLVRSAAHITGGGLVENLPRALPDGLGAHLDRETWSVPPIVAFLGELAEIPEVEMFRTFNMGVGMVLVVTSEAADEAVRTLEDVGVRALQVGRVVGRPGLTW